MDLGKIEKIVILTGAGISAESGIKTFRDSGGLWENHAIEDVASPEGFARDPKLVYDFYNKRRAQLLSPEVSPNAAHIALAKLQNEFKGELLLVTQNVDNLHESAGSNDVLHMHGELLKMRCLRTGKIFEIESNLDAESICSCCSVKGNLRPHIVWFGEMPLYMEKIQMYLEDCDLFISIGTSAQVYPAALFVTWTKMFSKKIEVNLNDTDMSSHFNYKLTGAASEKVPELVDLILS